MKGADENTRLVHSVSRDGYIAIDEERIVLTKVINLITMLFSCTITIP